MRQARTEFALVALCALLTACGGGSAAHAEEQVDAWARALREAEDRGWSMLDERALDDFAGEDTYVELAEAVAWGDVDWEVEEGSVEVADGIWAVFVRVDGGYAAVPSFLRDHDVVNLYCEDGRDVGFVVYAVFHGFGPSLGPGAQTGLTEDGRCPGATPTSTSDT